MGGRRLVDGLIPREALLSPVSREGWTFPRKEQGKVFSGSYFT